MGLRTLCLCAGLVMGQMGVGLAVEVPLLNPEALKRDSTHIVVGKLRDVRRMTEKQGDFEYSKGIAEIVVTTVEKGDGLKPGEAVNARFWNSRWVGKGDPPPHSGGHSVPAKGKTVRAFLKKTPDGAYEILLPNGLEQTGT